MKVDTLSNTAMSLSLPETHSFPITDEQNIDLFPLPTELTTAQAAAVLAVTEGYVNELLADGLIEHRLESGKHLIDCGELLKYKRRRERRRAECRELMNMFQEMGLSYD